MSRTHPATLPQIRRPCCGLSTGPHRRPRALHCARAASCPRVRR